MKRPGLETWFLNLKNLWPFFEKNICGCERFLITKVRYLEKR